MHIVIKLNGAGMNDHTETINSSGRQRMRNGGQLTADFLLLATVRLLMLASSKG